MKKLIVLCGKKQVGKSTSVKFIEEITGKPTVSYSLAGPLKVMTSEIFDVSFSKLTGSDAEKDSPTYLRWDDVEYCLRSSFNITYAHNHPEFISHRELLQLVGTNLFRSVRPDIWPELLCRALDKHPADIMVVDDARFINELKILREKGGILVKIYRNTGSNKSADHASETALDDIGDYYYDYVIPDDGNRTMDDLRAAWVKILGEVMDD